MNTAAFLQDPGRHFEGCYKEFKAFGGPCVYFHEQCLLAGEREFLSPRHLEMLYATLTAWGMHRMGDELITKTKLKEWSLFHDCLKKEAEQLRMFRRFRMLEMSKDEYSRSIRALKPCYDSLDLSVSNSTIVVNSKAIFHLLPELVPPIDRQYTLRFFTHLPGQWLSSKGAYRQIPLPGERDAQFELFHQTCVKIKLLADKIDSDLFEDQRRNGVSPPKAIDNAIVNFVRKTRSTM